MPLKKLFVIACLVSAAGRAGASDSVKNYEDYVSGLMAERSGDSQSAIQALQSVLSADKDAVPVYRDLALLYWQAGKADEAVETAEKYRQLSGGDVQALLFLGSFYTMAGKPEKSRECWEAVIKEDPDNESALLYLAAFYNETNPGKALEYWEKFVKQEPESSDAYYQMGLAREKLGAPEKAAEAFEKSALINPENQAARLSLAQNLENAGQNDKAEAQYEKFLTLDPKNSIVLQHLGGFYYKQKRFDQAQEMFERAIALVPGDDSLRFWLGVIAEEKKDFRTAIKYFEGISKEQQDPLVMTRLGYYYSSVKEYGKAVKTLRRVVELNPNNPYSYYLLGLAYLDSGDYGRAQKNLEKVLELKPEFYEVHFNLGVMYDTNGKFDKAVPELEKAILINPNFASALNYLGYSFADRGINLDRAEELIHRALKEEPENPAYMDSLGWTLFKKGKYEEAVTYIGPAAEKSRDPLILEHLGDAYVKLGKNAEAWEAYAKGFDRSPRSKSLKAKLKEMEKFLLPDTLRRKVLKRAAGNLLQVKNLSAGFSAAGEFMSNNTRSFGKLYYSRPDKWRADVLGSFFAPEAVLIQNNGLKVYPEAMGGAVNGLGKDFFDYLTGFFNGSIFDSFDSDQTVVTVKGDIFTYSSGGRLVKVSKKDGSVSEYSDGKVLIKFGKSAWHGGLLLPAEIDVYSLKDKAAMKIKLNGFEVNHKMSDETFTFAPQKEAGADEGQGTGKN
jgi:tetratricopeptide (TPR) repeat protein